MTVSFQGYNGGRLQGDVWGVLPLAEVGDCALSSSALGICGAQHLPGLEGAEGFSAKG